ncbi:MAG TPA: hypothetical protein VGR13_00060, partial [Actinomycetota bacterium]|nr:hypothetical protein [Actinomycetota bacterium]
MRDLVSELKAVGTSFIEDFATTAELPFIPLGLPAGYRMRMSGDAESASLKIYSSYPEGDPTATYELADGPASLPDRPGTYYLSLRGEWSDGWASYFSGFRVLSPGTVQIVFDEEAGKAPTAALWVDGHRLQGDVVHRTKSEGDDRVETSYTPAKPSVDAYFSVNAGASVQVLGNPTELSAALTGPLLEDASDAGTAFPIFGPYARIPATTGRHLLVLDAAWEHRAFGSGGKDSREDIRFIFPVNVLGSKSTQSPSPLPSGPIVITFDTSEEGKIPTAFARFGGRQYMAVMDSYRFTIDGEVFEASDQYRDAAMVGAATIVVPSGS